MNSRNRMNRTPRITRIFTGGRGGRGSERMSREGLAASPRRSVGIGSALHSCWWLVLVALVLNAAETEVFHFEVFLDPVFGSFAADARLLHAAEWRHFGRNQTGVDADDAIFERFGDAPDPSDVAAVEVGGEPV